MADKLTLLATSLLFTSACLPAVAPSADSSSPPSADGGIARGSDGGAALAGPDSGALPDAASPNGGVAQHPGATPTLSYYVVTAGDLNALYRTYPPNDPEKAWNAPLQTMQSQMLIDTLGLAAAGDANGSPGYSGAPTTTISCHLVASWNFDSGTGAEAGVGPCDWVNDMTSSDPSKWTLGQMGQKLADTINASTHKQDIKFISFISGETDANLYNSTATYAGSAAGSPYAAKWSDPSFRLGQFQQGFGALLSLVRAATGLSDLRMAVQVVTGGGSYNGNGGATDQIQQAELDAADGSAGDIILGNANPLQWVTENAGDEGYRFYTGQSYMDLALETGRAISYALGVAGYGDTQGGACYGQFPRITGATASGSSLLVDVSNPNDASTLVLPSSNPTQGWHVFSGSSASPVDYTVTSVALASPFQLRLTVNQALPTSGVQVTYGDHWSGSFYGSRYPALTAGGAVTDDASKKACVETTQLPRRDMPLAMKLL